MIAAGCLWYGIVGMVEGQLDARLWADLDRRGVPVTARVVYEGDSYFTAGNTTVTVPYSTVAFTDQGGASRRVDIDEGLQVGSAVGITYDPLDTSRVRITGASFPIRQAIGKVLVILAVVLSLPPLAYLTILSLPGSRRARPGRHSVDVPRPADP